MIRYINKGRLFEAYLALFLRMALTPDQQQYVTTLVNGACREQKRYNIWVSVMVRVVLCHQDWLMRDTAEEIEIFGSVRECIGHQSTCGPLNHNAILDEKSKFLIFDDGSSTTALAPTLAKNLTDETAVTLMDSGY